MAIRITETEMVSDLCAAHAQRVEDASDGEPRWMVAPVEIFGPHAGTVRLTMDQATTAMVLAELYALGVADTDKYQPLVRRYQRELGWW